MKVRNSKYVPFSLTSLTQVTQSHYGAARARRAYSTAPTSAVPHSRALGDQVPAVTCSDAGSPTEHTMIMVFQPWLGLTVYRSRRGKAATAPLPVPRPVFGNLQTRAKGSITPKGIGFTIHRFISRIVHRRTLKAPEYTPKTEG